MALLAFLISFVSALSGKIDASIEYTKQDSIRIVQILQTAKTERGKEPRTLYFGKKFMGTPYVAHTLEEGNKEHLIINTRGLDCTTFVETVSALSLCDANDARSFADFCHYLQQLRYRNGKINGYPSRCHYFTQWGEDNERMGWVKSVFETTDFKGFATQTISVNYMSTHPQLYKHLKANPAFVKLIKADEQAINGKKFKYLPKSKLNLSPSQLSFIHTGDIVSIITSKAGLDTSHVGFAVWQNGKLHLMHASSLYKKVVLDSKTFYDYSQGQKSQIGIRVYRLTE